MASQKMRAVVIVSHGGVEGLEVREVERLLRGLTECHEY